MKCPGQDMKYWKADAIFEVNCPRCGTAVEFYKDDSSRRCPRCDHRFVNPQLDFGCAAYCRFAEQCLGNLPEDFTGSGQSLLKDRVAVQVKRFFHTDFKKIREAGQVARQVERIGQREGLPVVVPLCAAYLHAVGSDAAREILAAVGADPELTTEILATLASQETISAEAALAAKVLHDALALARLDLDAPGREPANGHFFTATAVEIARELQA